MKKYTPVLIAGAVAAGIWLLSRPKDSPAWNTPVEEVGEGEDYAPSTPGWWSVIIKWAVDPMTSGERIDLVRLYNPKSRGTVGLYEVLEFNPENLDEGADPSWLISTLQERINNIEAATGIHVADFVDIYEIPELV